MKTSIVLLLSDILPHRKKAYHKVVKNKIFQDKKTDDVFLELKQLGLHGFELLLPQYASTTNKDIAEVEELSTKHNFPVLSVHQALRFLTATKINEIIRFLPTVFHSYFVYLYVSFIHEIKCVGGMKTEIQHSITYFVFRNLLYEDNNRV